MTTDEEKRRQQQLAEWQRQPPKPPLGLEQQLAKWQEQYRQVYARTQQLRVPPAEAQAKILEIAGPAGILERMEWERTRAQQRKQEAEQETLNAARAVWFENFYTSVPYLVATGKVASYEDYLNTIGSVPTEWMRPEDIGEARTAISQLLQKPAEREEVPEWLQVAPEEEAAVREFIKEPVPKALPVSINQLTTEEILKALQTPIIAQLPPGMTEEELLKVAALLDIPEVDLKAAFDIDEAIRVWSEAAKVQEQEIAEVLAEVREWEIPKIPGWKKAFIQGIISPMQTFADIMSPYLRNVAYPLAGAFFLKAHQWEEGESELERLYTKYRTGDPSRDEPAYSFWQAAGRAEREWSASWLEKLPIEMLVDPLTWIPGWGLSAPGRGLTKVPRLTSAGKGLLAFNQGIYDALDIPFDFAKYLLGRFPKSFNQIVTKSADDLASLVIANTSRHTGKAVHQFTPDDVGEVLLRSVEEFTHDPKAVGNKFVELGAQLSEHISMTAKQIYMWSRSRAGKLAEEVPDQLVAEVNDILRDSTLKIGSPEELATRMSHALMVEGPAQVAKLVRDIPTYVKRLAAFDIQAAIRIGKTAKIEPVRQMLDYLLTKQRAITRAALNSQSAKGKFFEGMVLGLQRTVDKVENHRIRVALDRYMVRPFAEANLGSVTYPIWNAFEGIGVSLMEGVMPGSVRHETFSVMTRGITGVDRRLATETASDVAGIFSSAPGRAGAWSLLPGKIPTTIMGRRLPKWIGGKDYLEWLGRRYIQISDVWSNALKRNYFIQKMTRHLGELGHDVGGVDVIPALRRLISGTPKIAKTRLGLSQHELEKEVFHRLTSGSGDVLELKKLLTNGPMMQGEQLKILRKVDQLSPQAKSLGEELISLGEVLASEDNIVGFTRQVADQAIGDLRRYPVEVADAFRRTASEISGMEIKSLDDLMDIFQTYEVMSQTVSNIPHKLMSQTMENTDILYRQGKFGAVQGLWRRDRQTMLDAMGDIADSMDTVREKILSRADLLTPEQRTAMEAVLERMGAGDVLREATLKADGQLLDDFWALPREMRTPEAHTELRAYRQETWAKYREEVAVIGGGEFVARKDFAKLYYNLPEPRLIPVNAEGRALSNQDVARALGGNVDALNTGLMESMAMQDRAYFTQVVLQSAQARPDLFKGFTAEKIGKVYDEILYSMKFTPGQDIMLQKVLAQIEGMKHELLTLRMVKSLKPDEQTALHAWLDKIAAGRDEIIGGKGLVSLDQWDAIRQKASDMAHVDMYKAFADYTNENIAAAILKMVYPYFTYHFYRWFFLPRTFLRHPGTALAWGKYHNYGDYGYQPTPLVDLEGNPFVGSVIGTTFGLTRFDFASYYENLGWFGEVLDYTQRTGFFPGAHFMLPVVLSTTFSGRPPELGEILPPFERSGLNLLVSSNIPGVASAAKWLKDKVFHENFHEYYTATILDSRQIEAGGTLIGGQTGTDLWYKKLRGEGFSEEEQRLWDSSYREASWYGLLRSQFPQFRLRTEEYKDAYRQVTKIFEEQLGMSEEFQRDLWRHHLRPTDVVGGLPLDLRMALDEIWQWKIYFGRGSTLMPPDVSDLYALIDKYVKRREVYQKERLVAQADIDSGFFTPTKELHFSGKEWRWEHGRNWTDYVKKVDSLEAEPEFADAVEALTPEGQVRLAKRLGFSTPQRHPLDEAIDLYFSIELEKVKDPYTGEEDYDYLRFWLKRESVRQALTEEQRVDFDAWIRRYETPAEATFRNAYNTYIRGYHAVNRVVLADYSEEQKTLIREFFADITISTRKEELRAIVNPKTGNQLISEWQSRSADARVALRDASPKLDFYLNVYGYVQSTRTPTADAMLKAWEKDKLGLLEVW